MRNNNTMKYAFSNKNGIVISLNTTIEKNLDIAIELMRKEIAREDAAKLNIV